MVAVAQKAGKHMSLRVQPKVRELIDQAAAISGKSLTDFILDSAKAEAINVLLDQRVFRLDEEQTKAFEAALDNPPKPSAALKKLMRAKAPWE